MSNVERTTSWQQIQQGVKDAERLIARKEYNLVMVKSRQTLECMVRCLAERACLVEGDLAENIDQLYDGRWIDRATRDNYHTIRILGNKAVHEGDDTAYDANQAYQLLTQEVQVFANEFSGSRTARASRTVQPIRTTSSGRQTATRAGSSQQRNASSARSSQSGGRSSSRQSYSRSSRQGTARRKRRKRVSPVYYIWRLLIPVLIVVLLIVVIRIMMPGKEDKQETETTPAVLTTAPTEPAPTAPPSPMPTTPPETEPVVEVYRTSGSVVNVRSEPSTSSRILARLPRGTEIDYVKRYNNDWAVINYDGQEVYISNQYIELVDPEAEETEGTTETTAQTTAP